MPTPELMRTHPVGLRLLQLAALKKKKRKEKKRKEKKKAASLTSLEEDCATVINIPQKPEPLWKEMPSETGQRSGKGINVNDNVRISTPPKINAHDYLACLKILNPDAFTENKR